MLLQVPLTPSVWQSEKKKWFQPRPAGEREMISILIASKTRYVPILTTNASPYVTLGSQVFMQNARR
jgi:hypothetical protein